MRSSRQRRYLVGTSGQASSGQGCWSACESSPRSLRFASAASSAEELAASIGEIADQAAGQVGTIYAGQRETVRRLYWLPAFGVIGLVLWQFARTTLEIVDDRRALGGKARRAST